MGQNVCAAPNKIQQSDLMQIQASEPCNLALQNLQDVDQNIYPLRRWLDKNNLNTFSVKRTSLKILTETPSFENKLSIQKTDSSFNLLASVQRNNQYRSDIQDGCDNIEDKSMSQMRKSSVGLNYKPIPINIDSFICVKKQKITQNYQILELIGQGSFGNVYLAKCLLTGEQRAIKSLKQRYMNQEQKKSLFNQIDILRRLDHPNIIKLYEVYIWNNFFYVVMQYCSGGSVLNCITKKQTYSETTISIIMKQLFSAVTYLHHKGIVHRDLKLQNMVFEKKITQNKQNELNIKIIDFGLALDLHKYNNKKKQIAGTRAYIAPQVYKGQVNIKNDIWSCGVIFAILLTGKNPFVAAQTENNFENITEKQIFSNDIWKRLSQGANDLACKLLKINHQKRITAQKALKHNWIVSNSQQKQKMINSVKNHDTILKNLASYQRGDNFVAVVRSFLAFKRITQQQKEQLTNLFQSLDKDHSGMIQKKELLQCYLNTSGQHNPKTIEEILQRIDFNNSGKIDFSQFLTATYNKKKLFMTQALREAFNHYDANKSGYLQLRQIKQVLQGSSNTEINQIFKAIDTNEDNLISFEEFVKYLQSS